ncbi:MAG: FAD-dependent oxidoreductase [Bacteroidia bacterium]
MRVLIIGGGICGLATAIALTRRGIDCQVFEAAPALREVGAGILLGANAMRVCDALGVAGALQARSNPLAHMQVRTFDGSLLQDVDGAALQRQFGHASYAIHRATLQQILAGFVGDRLHTGHRFSHLEETATGVTAYFDNGTQATGDLLIGADGIRSRVREQHVVQARYRYAGQTCWRAIVRVPLPPDEVARGAEVWGKAPGLRAMYVQVAPGEVYFWMTRRTRSGQSWPADEALASIREALAGFPGYMQEVLRHMQATDLIHTDLWDFRPMRTWYRGRVVLAGDAVHATTPNLGQGASQAIEDAYALAWCLAGMADHQQAFERYVSLRVARAHQIVRASYALGSLTNLGGSLGFWVKKWLTRAIPQAVSRRQLASLYGQPLPG